MTNDLQLPDGFNLVAYDQIDSTNEEAKRLALKDASHGTIVWAQTQTDGHGRRGRPWVSGPRNVYCSFILKPDCPLNEASQLSFVLAVSVANTLNRLNEIQMNETKIHCKWPNDILMNGKKVSGILLETASTRDQQLNSVIAGVGINVEHHPADTEFPATSIHAEGLKNIRTVSVLEALCDQFARWYAIWRTEGFQTIRYAWLDKAYGIGETASVRLAAASHSGIFEGLDQQGAMILNENGNRRHIAAGDVYFDRTVLEKAV